MYFSTKNYLKNTRNHTAKHASRPHPQVLDFKNGWVEIQYKIEWWGVLSELGENPNPHDDKSSSALLQEVIVEFYFKFSSRLSFSSLYFIFTAFHA
jgi:hypothetical protein